MCSLTRTHARNTYTHLYTYIEIQKWIQEQPVSRVKLVPVGSYCMSNAAVKAIELVRAVFCAYMCVCVFLNRYIYMCVYIGVCIYMDVCVCVYVS